MALQLWQTLKKAILAYTGMSILAYSPATFFTVLALGLAVYYVISGLFGSPEAHQRPRDDCKEQMQPLPPSDSTGGARGGGAEAEAWDDAPGSIKPPFPMAPIIKRQISDVSQSSEGQLMFLRGDVSFDFRKEETIGLDFINGINLKEKSSSKDDTVRATNPQEVKIINHVEAEEKQARKEKKRTRARKKKKIMHHSSNHKILLVGEGDFSFAACLARAFSSAPNIVATSLDSRVSLKRKYSRASINLKELEDRGCTVLHGVNAHTMSKHPSLILKSFDRIVFNFPHAGFFYKEDDLRQIEIHQKLVKGFLKSASSMLSYNGQVHITHKTAYPFSTWAIVSLAKEVGLYLLDEDEFMPLRYPGYVNKRGDGSRCDESFPIGPCKTYKFTKS
ncbi:uncharacterized protein At4g26485-like [Punica granatum]|uniref:Uncharacterized protein At4g26485-like n=1 Tax=Punica granatum TaxID=22663 RepID=A0A218XKY3_PUNGR|nr:uncharacterized protein At4g26485-like [Punica granatum]OWM85915.1 hypothetical protein CDL15_Pgr012165 [Punica granatum]